MLYFFYILNNLNNIPLVLSTFEIAASNNNEFDSVYSTKTNSNFKAVFTTNRY